MNGNITDERAARFHQDLPGIARAALVDSGLTDRVIDRHHLGWDGAYITVPIRGPHGRVSFFERWKPNRIGVPATKRERVELFGWGTLLAIPEQTIFAEGIHEALILESQGFSAVAGSDSGLFFKIREWTPALSIVLEVAVALRRGQKRSRRKYTPSRSEILEAITDALPHALRLNWPKEVGEQGGAYEYFVKLDHTPEDLRALLADAR